MPGELVHAVKCICNQIFTPDDIATTLQDQKKRKNIGKYSQHKNSIFKEKQLFRVDFKDKLKERVVDVRKKKISYQNCGSTDQYANKTLKAKKKLYAIEEVPEEGSPTEDSESESMGDTIGDQYDEDQDKREEFLV
ncbi:hypothetical protein O181_038771 [Austropuccinia psidii MF-1]|uniref:Uncharacterized protein n=1 Tax=Austropuccinia psidii MF-1 TaxID=1389203 RepID=A0A9Q3DEL9_9BASI|nr:hypothetical protein [Austropuccinia psidii MF-1]